MEGNNNDEIIKVPCWLGNQYVISPYFKGFRIFDVRESLELVNERKAGLLTDDDDDDDKEGNDEAQLALVACIDDSAHTDNVLVCASANHSIAIATAGVDDNIVFYEPLSF